LAHAVKIYLLEADKWTERERGRGAELGFSSWADSASRPARVAAYAREEQAGRCGPRGDGLLRERGWACENSWARAGAEAVERCWASRRGKAERAQREGKGNSIFFLSQVFFKCIFKSI